MPSAQEINIEESFEVPAAEPHVDLHSLLNTIRPSHTGNLNVLHGRGSVLFAEGEPARGVHLLRTGRAVVSIASSEGRVVMLRIAQAGDAVGLNSVLRDCPYDTTVKALEPCRTDFVSRAELMELMQRSPAGADAVLNLLSRELTELTERAKLLLLPQTVSGRLAKLLLGWINGNSTDSLSTVRLDRLFTHEEIAQMICTSRETVTRLLSNLCKKEIISVTSDSILIYNRLALEKLDLM